MLRFAQPGDTVEVLEEGVGPQEAYLMCRSTKTGQTGMYLTKWVQKQEETGP